MGFPPKPTPLRNCAQCGAKMERKRYPNRVLECLSLFRKRKYCNVACMAAAQEGLMKTATARSGRRQSVKAILDACEDCGRKRTETRLYVHHRDGNPLNNEPENLRTLCGSCHRLSHSPNYMGTRQQPKPCLLCASPRARKGYCGMHLQRLKRYGDPCLKKRKIGSEWVLMRADG